MYKNKLIGVVVPAYNEEEFIGEVIETMPEYVDRIYAIDDCSTDGTWERIQRSAEDINSEYARVPEQGDEHRLTADGRGDFDRLVVPIRHKQNQGVGGSIKTGYKRALEDDIDAVAVMAGDGQMDPDILDRLLDPIVEERADYAKGNRLRNRDYRDGMSKFRLFGNAVLTFLTKAASGYWKMMDPQNGYTVISKTALERIDLNQLYDDYGFANHLLVHLNIRDLRVADVPTPAVYRDEQSWISYSSFIPKTSKLLLSSFLNRLKTKYMILNFHPLVFFYMIGIICTVLGLLGGGYTLWAIFRTSLPIFPRGTPSIILFMMGSMFILFAMLFDMQSNANLEIIVYD
jgi:glycosyltransferase involved in cell wall biosynthesis